MQKMTKKMLKRKVKKCFQSKRPHLRNWRVVSTTQFVFIKPDLSKTFLNKKVVVTGHTGFKGSWLSLWLKQLGAKVTGVSLDIPTKPSLYETSKLQIENVIIVSKIILAC